MTAINRGQGTTDSEKYLVKLADRTFLDLWSYPNLYIDKMVGGQGKELCDLLVVCGPHVIIFSDKSIKWPDKVSTDIAWRRWYKRAIYKSVGQINGAARWLIEHPDRIFLDKKCTKRLPLPLPPADEMQMHGVVVARGAGTASRKYFDGGTGSLFVMGDIQGNDHFEGTKIRPLVVGDVNPDGLFVHVLDDGSLDIVLEELDTISDLTDYLSKKEQLLRSDQLISADGEEDLVGYFMTHMVSEDEHGFCRPDRVFTDPRKNRQYLARKKADEISYLWDNLIRAFTENMLAGTTLTPEGQNLEISILEEGVRYMALEPRFRRRKMGEGIADALGKSRGQDRFVRAFIPPEHVRDSDTGFFFLTVAVPDFEIEGGYEGYRKVRQSLLEVYALSFLHRHQHLKRIVGISTEPPAAKGAESRGSSEDLILAEAPEWSEQLVRDLMANQEGYGIMQDGNYREYAIGGQEWPDVKEQIPTPNMNRQRCRVMAAIKRWIRNRT